MQAMTVTFDDVAAAARRIEGQAHRTPVSTSTTLDRTTGCRAFVKCENLQRGGAFRFFGAARGLRVGVAVSGGNVDLAAVLPLVAALQA